MRCFLKFYAAFYVGVDYKLWDLHCGIDTAESTVLDCEKFLQSITTIVVHNV